MLDVVDFRLNRNIVDNLTSNNKKMELILVKTEPCGNKSIHTERQLAIVWATKNSWKVMLDPIY